MTFPFAVTKASSWGVESSTGLASGACVITGRSLDCKLNAPMPTSSTFLVGFAPPLAPLEKLQIGETFSGGSTDTRQYIVPEPAALKVSATAAATTPVGSPAGTVFIVTLTVSGPIQEVLFDPVPGNSWYVAGVGGLTNMLACGPSGTQQVCLDPSHPTAPAGTYHAVLAYKNPVAPGTRTTLFIPDIPARAGHFHKLAFVLP